jgi:hypothetical protein
MKNNLLNPCITFDVLCSPKWTPYIRENDDAANKLIVRVHRGESNPTCQIGEREYSLRPMHSIEQRQLGWNSVFAPL